MPVVGVVEAMVLLVLLVMVSAVLMVPMMLISVDEVVAMMLNLLKVMREWLKVMAVLGAVVLVLAVVLVWLATMHLLLVSSSVLLLRGLHLHFLSGHPGNRSAFGKGGLLVVLIGAGFVVLLVGVVCFRELSCLLLLSLVVGFLPLLGLCLLSLSLRVSLLEGVGGFLGRGFPVFPMVLVLELGASLLPSLVQIV
jgi:hypothetical protein